MKRLGLLLAFAAIIAVFVGASGDYRKYTNDRNALCSLVVTDAGDTAEVVKLHTFTARDSFVYTLDVEGGIITAVDSAIEWASPLQICRLTITGPVDSTQVYCCSLDAGTHVYGFTLDPPGTDTTAATLCGAIADSINAVAGMSDTVTAEDSVSYVKITSNFAQDHLEGDARWAIHFTTDGTVLDTASTVTTIKMVCDSNVATANAIDSFAAHFTAAVSGDTVWSITSLKKGVAFTVDVGDSAQDTSITTPNKTSKSTTTKKIVDIGPTYGYKTILAKFKIYPEVPAVSGIGQNDSCWLYLYSIKAKDTLLITRDSGAALPCSLMLRLADDVGDTLLGDALQLRYTITDTCSDTNLTITHPIMWDVTLK